MAVPRGARQNASPQRENLLICHRCLGSSAKLIRMARWIFRGVFGMFVIASLWWFTDTVATPAPPKLGSTVVLKPAPTPAPKPAPAKKPEPKPAEPAPPIVQPPPPVQPLPPVQPSPVIPGDFDDDGYGDGYDDWDDEGGDD